MRQLHRRHGGHKLQLRECQGQGKLAPIPTASKVQFPRCAPVADELRHIQSGVDGCLQLVRRGSRPCQRCLQPHQRGQRIGQHVKTVLRPQAWIQSLAVKYCLYLIEQQTQFFFRVRRYQSPKKLSNNPFTLQMQLQIEQAADAGICL